MVTGWTTWETVTVKSHTQTEPSIRDSMQKAREKDKESGLWAMVEPTAVNSGTTSVMAMVSSLGPTERLTKVTGSKTRCTVRVYYFKTKKLSMRENSWMARKKGPARSSSPMALDSRERLRMGSSMDREWSPKQMVKCRRASGATGFLSRRSVRRIAISHLMETASKLRTCDESGPTTSRLGAYWHWIETVAST